MTIFGNPPIIRHIVLEKYVGGNFKEFKIIESELAKLIAIIKKNLKPLAKRDKLETGFDSSKLNNSDHTKMIEAMFKKFFGLKDFILTWEVQSVPNAYTFCKAFTFLDRNFEKDKTTGRQYNKNLTIGVVVNTGLITYCNLNEKELLAIILHEIGHNFYRSVFYLLSVLSFPLKDILNWQLTQFDIIPKILERLAGLSIRDIFDIPAGTVYSKKLFSEVTDKYFPRIMTAVTTIRDIVYNISSLIIGKNDLDKLIETIKTGGFFTPRYLFKYNVEKYADSFAVDHGYGPELASALIKMEKQENSLHGKVTNIPILNLFYDVFNVQKEMILRPIFGYPSNQNRIRTGLDRLKRNLNDPSLDPRIRKELEKEIAQYEDFYYNVYLELEKNDNKKRIFSWAYANMVEKVFGGKMDLRELVYALDPEKYN